MASSSTHFLETVAKDGERYSLLCWVCLEQTFLGAKRGSRGIQVLWSHFHLYVQMTWSCWCHHAGMRFSTSRSEPVLLSWKRLECGLWVRGGVLFKVKKQMEWEIDKWITAASTVLQTLYRTLVVKGSRFLGSDQKNDTCDHNELSLQGKLFLGERVRSSVIHIKTSQLRCFGQMVRIPLGRLTWEVLRAHPTGKRPQGWPRICCRNYVSCLACNALEFSQKGCGKGHPGQSAAPMTRLKISRRKWMDEVLFFDHPAHFQMAHEF